MRVDSDCLVLILVQVGKGSDRLRVTQQRAEFFPHLCMDGSLNLPINIIIYLLRSSLLVIPLLAPVGFLSSVHNSQAFISSPCLPLPPTKIFSSVQSRNIS